MKVIKFETLNYPPQVQTVQIFILPCLKRISGSYHKKQSRLNKCIIWQCFLCLHEIMKRNEFDSLTFHIARLHIIALYHDLHSIWQLYLFLISILTKSI